MPQKKAVKKVAKKATKKTTAKKVVAKRVPRKRGIKVEVSDKVPTEVGATDGFVQMDSNAAAMGQALHASLADAIVNGGFSSGGLLSTRSASTLSQARGAVVRSIKALVQVEIDHAMNPPRTQGEVDVQQAEQTLAITKIEKAMDDLEAAVRG